MTDDQAVFAIHGGMIVAAAYTGATIGYLAVFIWLAVVPIGVWLTGYWEGTDND